MPVDSTNQRKWDHADVHVFVVKNFKL